MFNSRTLAIIDRYDPHLANDPGANVGNALNYVPGAG